MSDTCLHGHPWSPENTRIVATRGGYLQRQCKACARERSRIHTKRKYRNDLAFREEVKARARAWYAANRRQTTPPDANWAGDGEASREVLGHPRLAEAPATIHATDALGQEG